MSQDNDALEERLIRKVMNSSDVNKSEAIAILVDQGLLMNGPDGDLLLTEKGHEAARKAGNPGGSGKLAQVRGE